MATMNYFWHDPVLPWSETENDQRFKKVLRIMLILAVIFGIIVPLLPSPKPVQKRLDQVSPRLAKLIIEKQKQKPIVPKVKPRIIKKKIKSKSTPKTKAARKKAQQSGLMAMRNELAALQNAFDMSSLTNSTPLSKAETSRTTSSRSTLDKSAKKGSGGINTSSLSRQTGGSGIAGRRSQSVKSNISTGGSGQHRESSRNTRAEEEIALVFEKNKGAVLGLFVEHDYRD